MTCALVDIHLHPNVGCDIIDITEQVKAAVHSHGAQYGVVHVFSPHTTTAVRINENDLGLLNDFKQHVQYTIPMDVVYEHNKIDDRQNARAHLASMLYGASETIPMTNGQLVLGQWQSIFFIDFDGGRSEGRHVMINILSA